MMYLTPYSVLVPDCAGVKFFVGWFCGGWKGNDRCWSLSIDSDGGVVFDRSWSYCDNDYQSILKVCAVSAECLGKGRAAAASSLCTPRARSDSLGECFYS